MGGSRWSDDFYKDREDDRTRTGKSAFDYDVRLKADPRAKKVAHPKMSPHGVTRESRDSDAHPESVAIGVVFDVTGSMGNIPVELQKKLPQLMGLLLRKGYVKDPQILFGAVGDYFADRVPLQIGQFESGIEMDDDLGRLFLEGGGGGSFEESYQNALYFFARHTTIDCFEKRGKKGYLFLIGDEMPYARSTREEIERLIGDSIPRDIPVDEIIREAREKYHVFFVIPRGASHGTDPKLHKRWSTLLGEQNVIMLDEPDGVCEAIGVAIGLIEGTANVDAIEDDLADFGTKTKTASAVATALAPLARAVSTTTTSKTNLPEKRGRAAGVERL
ncbi:hypothetical protein AKJ09_01446 [Labilithrix luteola]|uniref:VWFA domain-containing protein n=1 Tax=Labilithrix luteola TaxID=1391654 RepID=A0A0K1PMP4_9BACT|nr:hypothetical protein [Labilithrix luteola]AKU94782.1 hypothetical protein AKJ09_01446 [Labilithrix luteola]